MQDTHFYAATPIPELYRWFAGEAAPTSPIWEDVCLYIADHAGLAELLDSLPGRKRQPNLFLAAIRYLGGPVSPGEPLASWARDNWGEIRALILSRATQTNEPGRTAVLAPLLASLPQPVALLEVGASAGLCLIPDRYRYSFDGELVAGINAAPDAPVMQCRVEGELPGSPSELRIASRLGLDLNPLNAADPDDARWLRALVWPGEEEREQRLVAALGAAAVDPPTVLGGSAPADLRLLLDAIPDGATPVILHSATLAYLARPDRDAFVDAVRGAGVRWVSFEGPTVVTSLKGRAPDPGLPHFIVGLDGDPVAVASPHGGWVRWL